MPRSIIFRLGLRYINRRLFQSVLFVLGVALGVAVVIAIDLANSSSNRAFALSSQSISGRATHQISSTGSGLPTSLYRQIRLELGIQNSAPIITQTIRAQDVPQPLQLLGVDPFAEPPFRDYLTQIEVIGEEERSAFDALAGFITEPGTVLISETLANDLGVQPGDSLTLLVQADEIPVRIIGVLRPDDDLSEQALDDLLMTDIATAQEMLGATERLSRIDLILEGEQAAAQIAAIRELLPPNAVLQSVQDSGGALEQMTEAFEINLQALSLLAVVVGIFLIYNTVTFSVVQRRPVIGILRSLGMTKRQVFTFIIGEAFVLGMVGTVLGLALGLIFGRFTVALVSQTINDLYFSLDVTTVAVNPVSLLKGLALGLIASTAAALLPSWDATRTAPAGSLKRSSLEEKTAEMVPFISVGAVVMLVLGYGLLRLPTTSLIVSFTALFFIIIGGAMFTPLVLVWFMRGAVPLAGRIFGVLGRMAPRSVVRSLSRTSVAVAALTIAVSVIIGVSVMIGSFRNTISNWLENTLSADIFISAPGFSAASLTVDLDPMLLEDVAATEGVASASASRSVTVTAPDYPEMPPVNLNAVSFDIAEDARRFVWKSVDNHEEALQAGQVIVSEPFAFRRDISAENNQLTLLTDQGEETFEVVGVFYDYSTDQGSVIMARSIYRQYWDDPFLTAVAAFVEPGASVDEVMTRLEQEVLAGEDVELQSNRALRSNVFEVFERTFTITVALRLLATLVAFIGILSALMSLQLEHAREYGVMRATGMTPNQLRGFTFIQTGLMGTVAGLLAIPIGLLLAVVLVYVINVRSFGWTMQFSIVYGEIAQAFLVAVVAALLAGVYPAFTLARMNVSRALRSE